MCGIAGLLTAPGKSLPESVLPKLEDALRHRGPDGSGRTQDGSASLVHTRLAIIDLETGDQPFQAKRDDGTMASLVANGEIYNYVELREALSGEALTTRSDCEPPLTLYLRHGTTFTEHLRGMYAIAIHDHAHDRLVLARDPFGIKPLYYADTPVGLAFASEPQALFSAGLATPTLRPQSRDQLLQLQFTTGRETPFEGIYRVLPGETVVAEAGSVVSRTRRAPLPPDAPRHISAVDALDELDHILNDAVGIHQRSDVPYGMFLSGGIDSSVLLAMMARLNERPVRAFTIGFPGTRAHDERDHARAVAKATGAEHVELDFGEEDFWQLLPEVAGVLDDPAADYATLPTYKLAAAVKEAGLKVILSGEGGDETFGGYGRYRRAVRMRLLGGRPMRAKGIFDGLGILRDESRAWRRGIAETEQASAQGRRSRLQMVQAIDSADWLPNDLLIKLDRCLMAHGVEGRVPFLDPKLAEFAFRLPDKLKIQRGLGKWLLRRWLETRLPASRPFSPKRGFTVPVGEWIAGRGGALGSLVARQPGIEEACQVAAVERLFANPGKKSGKAAWTLLFYALWHQRHILGIPAGGDVFATLSQKP